MTKASPTEHDALRARIDSQSQEIARLRALLEVNSKTLQEADAALLQYDTYGEIANISDTVRQAAQAAAGRMVARAGDRIG